MLDAMLLALPVVWVVAPDPWWSRVAKSAARLYSGDFRACGRMVQCDETYNDNNLWLETSL